MRDAIVPCHTYSPAIPALTQNAHPNISTERLTLRRLQTSDAPELLTLYKNSSVAEFLERPHISTAQECQAYLDSVLSSLEVGEAFFWSIFLSSSPILIGAVYLWNIYTVDRRAEIGLELMPDYQHMGLGHEALTTLVPYCFQSLGFHSLEADVDPDNTKAIALLKRIGFVREGYFREVTYHNGRFRDRAIYSLINSTHTNSEQTTNG